MKPADIELFFATLRAANPQPASELDYTSVFELLAAVLLSAQATDVSVNKATKRLFALAPTPQMMLDLGVAGIEAHIKTIGLFRNKAKNLHQTCRLLIEQHGGQVPRSREALEALPGVGRKTANVVLNVAFGEPTMAVDTHIFRVGNRTGLAPGKTPLRSRDEAHRARARGLPRRRPPLAHPARPLRLPGAQAAVLAVRRGGAMRLRTEGSGAVMRSLLLSSLWFVLAASAQAEPSVIDDAGRPVVLAARRGVW